MAVDPTHSLLAIAHEDLKIQVYDYRKRLKSLAKKKSNDEDHRDKVTSIDANKKLGLLASSSLDKSVKIWSETQLIR
jgi:WD40 repeat protein